MGLVFDLVCLLHTNDTFNGEEKIECSKVEISRQILSNNFNRATKENRNNAFRKSAEQLAQT